MKTKEKKEKGESIYKMPNSWLRNCCSILTFMKKEIKDINWYTGRKGFESSWTFYNGILMNNNGPSHTLKDCTFLFINFTKTFIIQITWNAILYHWHLSPAINYGKLLVLFFFWMFPKPTSFSLFSWFVPNGNNRTTRP